MRQMHSWVPTAGALIAFVLLGSAAAAAEIDPTSAVRGSLGASLDDLMLSISLGAWVFFLNAGCLLLLGAVAIIAQFRDINRRAKSISAQAYWAAR